VVTALAPAGLSEQAGRNGWRRCGQVDCFRVADDPLGGISPNGYALKRLSVGRALQLATDSQASPRIGRVRVRPSQTRNRFASEIRFRSLVGSRFTSSQLPNNRGRFWDIALALWSTASK